MSGYNTEIGQAPSRLSSAKAAAWQSEESYAHFGKFFEWTAPSITKTLYLNLLSLILILSLLLAILL